MLKKTKITSTWLILFLVSISPLFAQSKECGNEYICWKNKGDENFKGKIYGYAIDCYRAAQACDDAPVADTLESIINLSQKAQIDFEKEKTEALNKAVEKNASRKKADDVVSKYLKANVPGDQTLALLALHNQSRQNNNSHLLTAQARCELISDTNNLFYKQQLNLTTYLKDVANIKFNIKSDFSLMFAYFIQEYEPKEMELGFFDANGKNLPIKPSLSSSKNYNDIQMSPNGQFLVLVSEEQIKTNEPNAIVTHTLSVLAMDGKTPERPLNAIKDVSHFDFSKTGDTICVLEKTNTVSLINVKTGLLLNTFPLKKDAQATIDNWGFSPDGKSVMGIYNDSTLRVWQLDSKETYRDWQLGNGSISTAVFSPDSRHVAVGFMKGGIWVLNIVDEKNKKQLQNREENAIKLQENTGVIRALDFSPNGQFLLSGGNDNHVYVWDWQNEKPIHTYFGHEKPVVSVGFSNDGQQFFSMSDDNKVNFWAFKTAYVPFISEPNLKQSRVSADGQIIFLSFTQNTPNTLNNPIIMELRHRDGRLFHRFTDVINDVYTPLTWFSADSRYFAICQNNGAMEIWDIAAPKALKIANWTPENNCSRAIFSNNTSLVYIIRRDNTKFIYDLITKKEIPIDPLSINVQFSPDGEYWITDKSYNSGQREAQLFNRAGKNIPIKNKEISFTQIAFLADNQRLIATSKNEVYLYHLTKDSLQKLPTNFGAEETFFTIKPAPQPFEKYFFISSKPTHAQIWHLDSLNKSRFNFDRDTVSTIEFNAQGDYFLTQNTRRGEWRIRQTNNRRIIATFGAANVAKFAPSHDSTRIYFVAKEALTQKTYLGEVPLKEGSNDAEMAWKEEEIGPGNVNINDIQFIENLDSIVFKTNSGIYTIPNRLKQLNDGTLLAYLDNKTKNEYGLLTDNDCLATTNVLELAVCIGYYATISPNNAENLKKFNAAINQFYTLIEPNDTSARKKLYNMLQLITPAWEYEKNYNEKFNIEREIVRLIDSLPDNLNEGFDNTVRGTHYGNLCWYSLFDISLPKAERVKQCIQFGEKAVKYSDADWIQANLGHGYLFSGQIDRAKEKTRAFLPRGNDIIKDYQLLDDYDIFKITDPRIQAMLSWINEEKSKKK